MITLIIADQLPVVAAGLQALSRLHIINLTRATWAANSISDAIKVATEESDPVVVIDKAYGFQAIIEALQKLKGIPVIVWGNSITPADVLRFVQAGARGVVGKADPIESIFGCIRAVAAGGTWTRPVKRENAINPVALTPRQKQIAALVAQGMKNREIAAELGMQPGTVKVHMKAIFERTGIQGRAALALSMLTQQGAL